MFRVRVSVSICVRVSCLYVFMLYLRVCFRVYARVHVRCNWFRVRVRVSYSCLLVSCSCPCFMFHCVRPSFWCPFALVFMSVGFVFISVFRVHVRVSHSCSCMADYTRESATDTRIAQINAQSHTPKLTLP